MFIDWYIWSMFKKVFICVIGLYKRGYWWEIGYVWRKRFVDVFFGNKSEVRMRLEMELLG